MTADEMREMQWVRPELVAQIRFECAGLDEWKRLRTRLKVGNDLAERSADPAVRCCRRAVFFLGSRTRSKGFATRRIGPCSTDDLRASVVGRAQCLPLTLGVGFGRPTSNNWRSYAAPI